MTRRLAPWVLFLAMSLAPAHLAVQTMTASTAPLHHAAEGIAR